MKIDIIEQKENVLLNRKELFIVVENDIIPSKKDITKNLSEKTKNPEENIVVDRIDGDFGNHIFRIKAKIYHDSKSKDKYTVITRKVRKKAQEEAKKANEAKAKEGAA